MLSRRKLLQKALLLSGMTATVESFATDPIWEKSRYKIGICDWSLEKNSDPESFALAKQLGVDGIMVNMGSEKDGLHLRKKEIQDLFMKASMESNIPISSLALGVLNDVPYKSDPRTIEWVWDSISTARHLQAPVILLAFFHKNDLRNDDAGKKEVIKRLKEAAPHAEKNNIILGIESYLNADEHKEIIEAVGSKNVKVYYDFRNTADAGLNPITEFKKLGSSLVCELHIKENKFLLGKGSLDWNEIKIMLEETGFSVQNWMQIEWSYPDNHNILAYQQQNLSYLRKLFDELS